MYFDNSIPTAIKQNRDNPQHRPDSKPNHPDKLVTVYIDSRPFQVEKNHLLTYEDIVRMWQGHYTPNDGVTYNITFSRGHSEHAKGELLPGESLKAKEGLVINIGRANRS